MAMILGNPRLRYDTVGYINYTSLRLAGFYIDKDLSVWNRKITHIPVKTSIHQEAKETDNVTIDHRQAI